MTAPESLPTDLAAAHAIILAERTARLEAEALAARAQAEAASAKADLSSTEALMSHLKLEIAKLRRQLYGSRSGGGSDADRTVVPAQAAVSQTLPRASAARARRDPRTRKLSLLRVEEAIKAGRGHHRDAGGHSPPVEGDADGAREILVPGLRDDHAATGALPCDAARLCRP